jgi:hypothetical protein
MINADRLSGGKSSVLSHFYKRVWYHFAASTTVYTIQPTRLVVNRSIASSNQSDRSTTGAKTDVAEIPNIEHRLLE